MHGISNRDTFVSTRRTTANQFIWQQQQNAGSGQITNEMRSDWRTLRDSRRPDLGTHPPGMALPRIARVWLNRLRTRVGRFRSWLHKCGMAHLRLMSVAHKNRPSTRLSFLCPIHRPPYGAHGLTVPGWRDNRIAAQHLPRDLVRPSNGLEQGLPTFLRSRTTSAPLTVNAYYFFQN